MVSRLEKISNESESMFTKQHHVLCMAKVLNLVVQGGLTELDNPSLTLEFSEGEDNEECEEYEVVVLFKTLQGEILFGFENLFW